MSKWSKIRKLIKPLPPPQPASGVMIVKTRPGIVTSRLDGTQRAAEAAVCEDCECTTFYIVGITDAGKLNTHFQCSKCSAMYCSHEGICSVRGH